jgi:aconitate hydratase
VLSGNRNFAGRISPHVKANFLASPPLVVAYALAGTVDINFDNDPIGQDTDGNDVFLKDLWPTQEEILEVIQNSLTPEMYTEQYGNVYTGNETWNAIPSEDSAVFNWQADSTYIQEPPFWQGLDKTVPPVESVKKARVLALLGDSITTDHISPAGAIAKNSPAGRYLTEHGIERKDFNTYGSRRGNHEVMMRGTFANVRLRNLLIPGSEGGVTLHIPSGEEMAIYDASMRYQDAGTDLIVLAGGDYGMGSSRDWAAKGTQLLGVKAVIAKSFERIHRSNLVMMGVLPLQFKDGEGWEELGLTGHEEFDIPGLSDDIQSGQELEVTATAVDGTTKTFTTVVRLDGTVEVDYYKNGGILHTVLRKLM